MKKLISVIICVVMIITAAVAVFANDVLLSEEESEVYSGDVNGDKAVDNKDVVALFRHLSDGKTEIVEANSDFNNDGAIDNKDVVALFRYLSGGGAGEVTDDTETEPDETETEPDETEPEETKPVLDDSYFIFDEYSEEPLVYMKRPDGYTFYENYLNTGLISGVKDGVQDGTCFFNFMMQDIYPVMTEETAIPFLDATKNNFQGQFGDYELINFESYELDGLPVTKLDWVWDNGISQSLVRVHFDYCTVIIQFASWATVPEGMDEFNEMIATLGICEEAL